MGSVLHNAHKELTENITDAVINQERDTLDTSTTGKTTNSWLGNTLEVVARELSVTLSTSLSKSFSSCSFARHVVLFKFLYIYPQVAAMGYIY